MADSTAKSVYLEGVRDGLPFVLMAGPFALLFGVVAVEAGLTVAQAMGFSVLVIAGASQFAALQMMVENAGLPLVLLAALAVNLRMAMYSAALVPGLGAAPLWQRAAAAYLLFDQTYVASAARYDRAPALGLRERVAYFFGVATPITPTWVLMTLAGILGGSAIPETWALDFILPLTFLAMVAPMLRTLAHLAAAGVAVVLGLALAGLPSGMGLLIAAAAAMATGALVEGWQEGRG